MKELLRENLLSDFTVVLAEQQTSGRGQMGASWFSKQGQSLTFSVFKDFKGLAAEYHFVISMAVSTAIYDALNNLNIPNLSVKWPNDIMSAKKKIGGILIENVLKGSNVQYSIIGIGLNVNVIYFPDLPQASSMNLESGREFILDEVLLEVLNSLSKSLENLSVADFVEKKKLFEDRLFRKDVISVFEDQKGFRFNGIIKGVSDLGELLVETENEKIQNYQLKEIKLIF